jgi:hypothetical protein
MADRAVVCQINAANKAAPSARAAQPHLGDAAMMDEGVQHRDYRLSSLEHRHDEYCRAVRLPGTVWTRHQLPGTVCQPVLH